MNEIEKVFGKKNKIFPYWVLGCITTYRHNYLRMDQWIFFRIITSKNRRSICENSEQFVKDYLLLNVFRRLERESRIFHNNLTWIKHYGELFQKFLKQYFGYFFFQLKMYCSVCQKYCTSYLQFPSVWVRSRVGSSFGYCLDIVMEALRLNKSTILPILQKILHSILKFVDQQYIVI